MRRGRMILAAIAGVLVSFVVFAGLVLISPDEGLQKGEGEVVWEGFQFQQEDYTFTRSSVARVVNEDSVPVDLVVMAPGGQNLSFVVPVGGFVEVDLEEEGSYRLSGRTYEWGEAEIEVRSSNPFVRFFEDVF